MLYIFFNYKVGFIFVCFFEEKWDKYNVNKIEFFFKIYIFLFVFQLLCLIKKNIEMRFFLYVYDEKVLSVGLFFIVYMVFYLYSLQVLVRSCNI